MGIQGGHWASVACLAPKPCDSCKASPAAVFCRADSAYLCLTCDAKIHSANKLTSRHARVWMCEVCEHAPAAVTCKADAAALCVTCDSDIHSANPLASRHERVPITPFFDSVTDSIAKSTTNVSSALNFFVPHDDVLPEEPEAMSLLIPNPNFINNPKFMDMIAPDMKSGDVFFSEMDSLLEFDYPNPIHHSISGSDSVVPVKTKPLPVPVQPPNSLINCNQASTETCFDIDFCRSKLSSSFSYPTHSLNQSVSSSSLDVGVVPDGSSLSEISYPFTRNANHTVSDPGVPVSGATSAASQATQLCGLDREARVLRYREKRKNRKFQKTIRYASRKAYAETRPRIKGRFVKRTETETEGVDRIYGSDITICSVDSQYGVVPTF